MSRLQGMLVFTQKSIRLRLAYGCLYDTIKKMSKRQKLIARMQNNPRDDWSIHDLKMLANDSNIDWRQPGTSHVTFSYPGIAPLTVPAHKSIKPIYIKRFIELMTLAGEHDDE